MYFTFENYVYTLYSIDITLDSYIVCWFFLHTYSTIFFMILYSIFNSIIVIIVCWFLPTFT